jgi:excisionase family DNA binding protein
MQERLLVGKCEACQLLGGISLRTLDYLLARGELTAVRVGRRVMFHPKALQRFARKDHPPETRAGLVKARQGDEYAAGK